MNRATDENSTTYDNGSENSPCRSYLSHLRRRGYSEATIITYRAMLDVFLAWLKSEGLDDPVGLNRHDLDRFLIWLREERGIENTASRANYLKVLRGLYEYLLKERRILNNPAAGLQYPRKRRRIRRDVLSRRELRDLLRAPHSDDPLAVRDRVLIRLLALSGLRIAELRALSVSRIDLEAREIRIHRGKGGKDRIVFIDLGTQSILRDYLGRARRLLLKTTSQSLLIGISGHPVGSITLRTRLRELGKIAGIGKKVTPHSLRRTFATLLLDAGCNLKVIAELMGHERLSTTAEYTRLDPESLARVYRRCHPLGGV